MPTNCPTWTCSWISCVGNRRASKFILDNLNFYRGVLEFKFIISLYSYLGILQLGFDFELKLECIIWNYFKNGTILIGSPTSARIAQVTKILSQPQM